jgi:hypothetical protein
MPILTVEADMAVPHLITTLVFLHIRGWVIISSRRAVLIHDFGLYMGIDEFLIISDVKSGRRQRCLMSTRS